MGVPSSAGQGPPRSAGRSIGSYLAARLVVPAVCLVLVWAAVAGAVFAGALRHVMHPSGHRAIVEAVVVAGTGLVVAIAVVALIWAAARQLAREAAGLAAVARYLADEQLPKTVARLRDGAGARGRTQQAAVRPARQDLRVRGRHHGPAPACSARPPARRPRPRRGCAAASGRC